MDESPYGETSTKFGDVSDDEISEDFEFDRSKSTTHRGEDGSRTIPSQTSPEPYRESEWDKAMRFGDCITLLKDLKSDPSLLGPIISSNDSGGMPIDPSDLGNTALHWAAKRRCLKLLVYILGLFMDDDGKVVKNFVDYFQKRNGAGIRAADFLWSARDYSIYTYLSSFSKYRELNPTLREMQLELLDPMYVPPTSTSSPISPPTSGALPENVTMREIIINATDKHKRPLGDVLRFDYNYNFVEGYDELLFHFACGRLKLTDFHNIQCEGYVSNYRCEEYVRAVIRDVKEEGPKAVNYLFNYRNAQGQAPFHCACIDMVNLEIFLELLSEELGPGEDYGDCYNSRDDAGWTVLHLAASQGHKDVVKALLEENGVDANAKVKNRNGNGATALHLAIIHDRPEVVRLLIEFGGYGGVDLNVPLMGYFPYAGIVKFELSACTPLYLALIMGRSDIAKALFDSNEVEDGLIEGQVEFSLIHIAAMNGDPELLRYLTYYRKFDISLTCKGCTALHFVVDGGYFHGDIDENSLKIFCHDKITARSDASHATRRMHAGLTIDTNRKACISMLIQGGLDVWQKNDEGSFPEVGSNLSIDVHEYWYQKVFSVTEDGKRNLNIAGNAISVVSALVATASYVGPLQPPLGFDSNSVHDNSPAIRVYMVTNTLSFYMAISSIIFAVVPSLPMPQESLYEEWQRSQRSIIYAVHLLLLAVISILISFGAASNVVLSSEYSWQHQGLVFYPSLLGGLISVVAISLFYLRLLKLTFVRNLTIKKIYQHVFRISQKEKVKVKDKREVEFEDYGGKHLHLLEFDYDDWIYGQSSSPYHRRITSSRI